MIIYDNLTTQVDGGVLHCFSAFLISLHKGVMHPSVPDECKPILLNGMQRIPFPMPLKKIKMPKKLKAGDGESDMEKLGSSGLPTLEGGLIRTDPKTNSWNLKTLWKSCKRKSHFSKPPFLSVMFKSVLIWSDLYSSWIIIERRRCLAHFVSFWIASLF